ncbi:hypothetical protein V6N13_065139 [Hibiscus sabdariffa]
MLAHVAESHIDVSSTSNVDQVKRLYSALWSLAIPTKIKVMFWRFIKNCLPTNVNLYNRRIHLDTTCTLCAGEAETVDHILFCPFTTSILSHLGIDLILPSSEQNWLLWLSSLFDQLDKKRMRVHWLPPLGDTIKVNFDACFSSRYRTSFSRVVAKNYGGSIMAAGTIPHHFVTNPEVAEAYACIDALVLARDVGFRSIIIEGDVLTVINKANCREDDRSVLRSLVM